MGVFLQISALFILMAVGYAVGKCRLVDSPAVKGLSNLIVNATLPALIVTSLQRPFSRELLGVSLRTLLIAGVFYTALPLLSIATVRLLKTPKKQRGTLAFSLGFSNAAFIGFPVITSILGQDALFCASIHNMPFNLLAYSAGVLIVTGLSGGAEAGGEPVKARIAPKNILNINVCASVVGFALFVSSTTLPRAIALPMEMLGSLTTPLAMIATGAMLARTSIRSMLGDWRLYAVSFLRLAVWPLLVAGALRLFGVGGTVYYVSVIVAGMPAASTTSLIAEVYGGDADSASAIVCMTTLFSVLTIPVMALILT